MPGVIKLYYKSLNMYFTVFCNCIFEGLLLLDKITCNAKQDAYQLFRKKQNNHSKLDGEFT